MRREFLPVACHKQRIERWNTTGNVYYTLTKVRYITIICNLYVCLIGVSASKLWTTRDLQDILHEKQVELSPIQVRKYGIICIVSCYQHTKLNHEATNKKETRTKSVSKDLNLLFQFLNGAARPRKTIS